MSVNGLEDGGHAAAVIGAAAGGWPEGEVEARWSSRYVHVPFDFALLENPSLPTDIIDGLGSHSPGLG